MKQADKLDSVLVGRATKAILDYEEKKKHGDGAGGKKKIALLDGPAKAIITQIQLTKEVSKAVSKPVRVKIPNSLFSLDEDHTICLFCKSDDKPKLEELLMNDTTLGVSKIISINDVRKYYKEFKELKRLLAEHTHFLCDAAIVRQLYNLLGKTFGARNNYPVPIEYNASSLRSISASILKAVGSTYMQITGKNISIRFGNTSMDHADVAQNIVEGLNFAVMKLKNEWKDVHSIHLKTTDSAALPIYSKFKDDMTSYVSGKVGKAADVASSSGRGEEKKEEKEKEKLKAGSASERSPQSTKSTKTAKSSSSAADTTESIKKTGKVAAKAEPPAETTRINSSAKTPKKGKDEEKVVEKKRKQTAEEEQGQEQGSAKKPKAAAAAEPVKSPKVKAPAAAAAAPLQEKAAEPKAAAEPAKTKPKVAEKAKAAAAAKEEAAAPVKETSRKVKAAEPVESPKGKTTEPVKEKAPEKARASSRLRKQRT